MPGTSSRCPESWSRTRGHRITRPWRHTKKSDSRHMKRGEEASRGGKTRGGEEEDGEAHAVEPHEEGLAAGMKLAEKIFVVDDEAEEGEEKRVVKSVPDQRAKSQKNKAKGLLAEVCSIPSPSTKLTFLFVETHLGGMSRAQTDDDIHKRRKNFASGSQHGFYPNKRRST